MKPLAFRQMFPISKVMEKLVCTAEETYGPVDILVNNAGICVLEDFLSADSFENRDKHFDINIKGVWNTTKAVLPSMFKTGAGAIVIMSSVTGDMVADPGEVAYATSKAALVGFTKAMAREVADKKIRVNAICPGYVLTPLVEGMAKQSDPEDPKQWRSRRSRMQFRSDVWRIRPRSENLRRFLEAVNPVILRERRS